jgi:biotin transport system substrate-specific component
LGSNNPIRQWAVVVVAVLFIAASARLSFDLTWHDINIPITGQSFAVLVSAMFLGRKWGFITILLYLLSGGLGLPFFADGASGWLVFTKGSAGFLIGFAVSALVVGWLADIGWRSTFVKTLLAMTIGTALIIACGLLWLTYLYGWLKALAYGFYPFVWGAVVKILLGALVVYAIEKYSKQTG